MASTLKRVGELFRTLQGWLYLLGTVVPTTLAILATFFEGLSWSTRILVATSTAAAGFILVYYGLCTFTFISERYGFRREVNAVADNLQELSNAGHEYIKVKIIADIWAGDRKEEVWVWNPRMRKLKEGCSLGLIEYLQEGRQNPSQHTSVKIASAIAFMRDLKSL